MKILLIEDDPKIASFIMRGLHEENFCVDVCNNGTDGIYLLGVNLYDVVILDLMLPDISGFSVCQSVRSQKNITPIIVLSAKNSIEDKVHALNMGADDYLTKPFSFEELLARIRVQLRKLHQKDSFLRVGDLQINLLTKVVTRGDLMITLTSKEYAILEYLMRNEGIVISEEILRETIFSCEDFVHSNIINVYIYRIRNKIDKNHSQKLLHTLRNQGFVIRA